MRPIGAPVPSLGRPPASGAAAGAQGTLLLAQALFAEAGDRPVRAIEALAALAVNRARQAAACPAARLRFAPGAAPRMTAQGDRPEPWPALLGAVCRAPFFFRRWRGQGMPSGPEAARPPEGEGTAARGLEVCRRIAARAAGGALPDPTGGATHWHDDGELPGWTAGRMPTALIGGLVFYRA